MTVGQQGADAMTEIMREVSDYESTRSRLDYISYLENALSGMRKMILNNDVNIINKVRHMKGSTFMRLSGIDSKLSCFML